jgi:DNA-binding HxlR family transcriptional regulator
MDDEGFSADCRARLAFDLLSNTWNPVVVWELQYGPRRPGELRAEIGGISAKVLTETLRRLESNGLVVRRTRADAPHRVEYALTGLGRTLLEPIGVFGKWAFEHGDAVLAAQDRNSRARDNLAQDSQERTERTERTEHATA